MLFRKLLVLFFILSFGAEAQTVITLRSAASGKPVSTVPVRLTDSISSAVFSTVTDIRGNMLLPASFFKDERRVSLLLEAGGFLPLRFSCAGGDTLVLGIHPEWTDIGEVVVTGQLSERSSDASVQKVRVIDRSTMDAKGAVNLRDVLQSELNIRISQDQVLGSGMSLQGMSGQNVKILIDGVPVIGRVDGEIDLSQINLASIDRIEIVEGPSSVNYGSNALAGTINLITKKREHYGQNFQLNTYVESVGNYNLDARYAIRLKKTQLQLTGVRNFFDGWISGDPFYEFPRSKIADSGRYKSWNPKMQYQGSIRWIVPVKRLLLTPYLDYFTEHITNRGLPRAPYFNTAFDDHYLTARINAGMLIDIRIGERNKLSGVAAFNEYERIKNTYIKNLNTLAQQLTSTAGDQDTTRFTSWMSRLSFVHRLRDSTTHLETGYDINSETAYGNRIKGGHQTITELALFTNAEWGRKGFVAKPGARYTHNSAYGSSFTPAVHLKYSFRKWDFRTGVASGFRSPAIKELYLDFVDINHNIQGNTALQPETSLHYQLWISKKMNLGKIPFSVDANGYYQQVQHKIALAQNSTGTVYSYFNLDEYEATGAQLSMEARPGRHSLRIGGALMGTRSNLTVNGFAFSPELSAAGTCFWSKAQLTITAFYKYTGRVLVYLKTEEETPETTFMNDYQLLDMSLSRPFWKKRMIATVGGKNLLNVRQVVSGNASGAHSGGTGSTPVGWGRSIYVKLQFNLHTGK